MREPLLRLAQRIRDCLVKATRNRPEETRWTIRGAVFGLLAGLFVGGVGISAGGDAIGISGCLLGMVVFGAIGNRFGIGRDRKNLEDREP